MWKDFLTDLPYAWRGLFRQRRAVIPAMLTIALGIGVNVAIYSLVNAVLIRPLPFTKPDALFAVWLFIPGFQSDGAIPPRARDFTEWRSNRTPFSDFAALVPARFDWVDEGEPERLGGARVSPNFFDLLGVTMQAGRGFVKEEGESGRDRSVVISHGLWTRRFGRDPRVLGRTLRLDGEPVEIVGVLPAVFVFPTKGQIHPLLNFTSDVEIWKPLVIGPAEMRNVQAFDHAVIGRLSANGSAAQAASALEVIAQGLVKKDFGGQIGEVRARLVPLHEIYVGEARQGLLMLLAAAGLILLVACANVTHLLLARLTGRRAEIATRLALGARRGRVARQLQTETFLLVVAGTVLGVLLARWVLAAVLARSPAELVPPGGVHLDADVITFAVFLSIGTTILVGLLPLFSFFKQPIWSTLKPPAAVPVFPRMSGRPSTGSTLIAVQVALTSVVLFVSLLLLHSYVRILRVETGFSTDNVLTLDLSLPAATSGARVPVFYDNVLSRVHALPGVASAAAVSELPLTSVASANPVLLEGDKTVEQILKRPIAIYRSVSPRYFETMRIALKGGRLFQASEPDPVAIVSVALARALWPGRRVEEVLDQAVRSPDGTRARVIGVVADAAEGALGSESTPQIYRPSPQAPAPAMTLVVRGTARVEDLAGPVRATIREMAPQLPLPRARTMEDVAGDSILRRRFQLMTILVFALLGLALTLVGVYGVVSYAVAQRSKEIGIRIACGATPGEIVRHVLRRGFRPALIGLAIGIPAAIGTGWLLRSTVFGIGTLDPLSVAGASVLILLTAGVASFLPARQALRVDAVDTLRLN
jgi:predicted permease